MNRSDRPSTSRDRRAGARMSRVTLCLSAALLAACGGRDTDKIASTATESRTSTLTAAQVQAARRAQLINGYVRPTFFGPMASFPFDPNDVGVATQASGINDAGTVVGFTNRGSNLPPGGGPGTPFIVDAAGQAALDNPWPGGPAYAISINQHGDVLGFGGPGDSTNADFERPVVYHPDHSFQMLPLPASPASPTRMRPTAMNDDSPAGISTVVGMLAADAGALAVWHFDGDTSDAVGPSAFPPPANPVWTDGHRGQAILLDGNTCLSNPPAADTQPWLAAGLTLMAWVKPDPSMCPGGLRNVMRRSDDWGFSEDAADLSLVCNADGTAAITGDLWAGGNTGVLPPSGHIPLGQWTHLAITSDSTAIIGYVNGVLVGEHATSPSLSHGPPGLALGCRPDDPTTDFKGAIDELSLFANAMGADEIRLYYRDKTSYPVAGLQSVAGRIQQGFVDVLVPPEDPGHSPWASVAAINNAGVMAGAVSAGGAAAAAAYSPTNGWTNLNTLLAADAAWNLQQATAINDAGQVVGWGLHDGRPAMFRIDAATGDIIDLGHDTDAGFTYPQLYMVPAAINAAGHIAGSQYDQWPFWPLRAVIYTDETGVTDLNDLVDPTLIDAGWEFRQITSINDNDDVVGFAINKATGFWRAFKAHVPTLPSQNTIAVTSCNGKADGDACDGGGSCGQNNVCNAGVCGGGNAGGICLRVDGVADIGGGQLVAVFGHDSSAATSLHPDLNEELVGGTVTPSFRPAPPEWLPPGSHPGDFLPTFAVGQTISWRVDGQVVTASADSPHLQTTTTPSGIGAVFGATTIIVAPDLNRFAAVPPEATPTQEPDHGDPFNGALAGRLSVSPTGAALYSVPIAIPPGVAGMAPNLSLVYNSQGGNGIAGQGWELAGLSMIHRCPRTRIEDGFGRPVVMDDLIHGAGGQTDGVCLDGQRLFEYPDGTNYHQEKNTFSQITRLGGGSFQVTTKSGEVRSYGLTVQARVMLPAGSVTGDPASGTDIAIWLLDRVSDPWGNFYEIHYVDNFAQNGIQVQSIDYTGHFPQGGLGPDVTPFYSVTFGYEARSDVRWMRFGPGRLPRNSRLKTITTPRGQYTLTYEDSALNGSMLDQIDYTAGGVRLQPLVFNWTKQPAINWPQNTGYALPSEIPQAIHLRGVQFVDIDGDGRLDLLFGSQANGKSITGAWRNSGHGWDKQNSWAPPTMLDDANDQLTGVRFADVDGDGLPDIIQDKVDLVCPAGGAATDQCLFCTTQCGKTTPFSPAVWLNRTKQGGGWVLDAGFSTKPPTWGGLASDVSFSGLGVTITDFVADMDGDGRADLVRLQEKGGQGGSVVTLDVLLNTGAGWNVLPTIGLGGRPLSDTAHFRLQDVNRDGLPDVISQEFFVYGDSSLQTSELLFLNKGPELDSNQQITNFLFSAGIEHDAATGGTPVTPGRQAAIGDLDGDGIYDAVSLWQADH